MIIRTTFNDNDFTQVLESYWSNFWFKNYYRAVDKLDVNITDYDKATDEEWKQLRKWKDAKIEAEDLLQRAFYDGDMVHDDKRLTQKELDRFEKIIRDSILAYVEDIHKEDYDYLSRSLSVSIRKTLKDTWENGEVVYYLLMHKKYITM